MSSEMNKKYDVGLIGVGVGANYGSVLTYYSLYKTIESFGKSVLMVSKIGASADDPELKNTHAIKFAQKHYNLSGVYSQENVRDLNNVVNEFVIGSDQVWNYGISQNFGKAFYFDFVEDGKRKVSYASSYGHAKDFSPAEEVPKISALMRRFHAISVREDSGVKIARNIYGIPATQVAEPIFLTDTKAYGELASSSTRDVSEPYLLAYILDPSPEKKKVIEHIAKEKGLKIRVILDAWPHLFQQNKDKMGLPDQTEAGIDTYDFLKLYMNCDYVVTDSFHGTAFALKFEKPFVSMGNRRRGVARFDSIFGLVGHRERFTMDPEDVFRRSDDFLKPMDYTGIRKALDAHVDMSKKWLQAAFKISLDKTIGSTMKDKSLARPAHVTGQKRISGIVKKAAKLLAWQLEKKKFSLTKPKFVTSSVMWKVQQDDKTTRLNVVSLGAPVRGHLAWTDLPEPLRVGSAYEVRIDWKLRTTAQFVNIHIRDPKTEKFKVVGVVPVDRKRQGQRTDVISFIVPEGSFSQIMLGAVHFTGDNPGADIASISVRSILPENVVPNAASAGNPIRRKDAATAVRELAQKDTDRFIASYAQHRVSKSVENARSLLMFYSHGFEKGLSRSESFRPGFGNDYMKPLAEEMNKWLKRGRDPQDSFFVIATSVVHNYFARHKALDFDVSHYWKLFDAPVQDAVNKVSDRLGGAAAANMVRDVHVDGLADRGFSDVVFSRRSIREFNTDPVSDDDIKRAVQIAMQAPSVCNRQPVRVHQIAHIDAMKAALELQGGFRGYKLPPKLLLVTSDLSAFVGAVERNQAFIDGGLFMMLMLLGLQQVGLGSCSLNTAMNAERESAIRKILNIPESEVFISFVAVGHYDPEILVPKSTRIPVEEVLIRHSA